MVDFLQDLQVYSRIPDNTILSDLFAASLKLRLDQAGTTSSLLQEVVYNRQDQGQEMKGDIH